jgi:ribosomal protein S18 acetylase RimI-like enzyme
VISVGREESARSGMKDYHPLDNPVWEALNGKQSEFAVKKGGALRYKPDISTFAGVTDDSKETTENLSKLYKKDELVVLMGHKLDMPHYFIHRVEVPAYQMLTEKVPEYKQMDYVKLTIDDVHQITELVNITDPGPFVPNNLKLGTYVGIKEEGKLVAMVGERVRLDGYTEISLVCTHPDHRGKGYAKTLSGVIIEEIIGEGDIPFLNVKTQNVSAIRLYEKLGFTNRVEYSFNGYTRL